MMFTSSSKKGHTYFSTSRSVGTQLVGSSQILGDVFVPFRSAVAIPHDGRPT